MHGLAARLAAYPFQPGRPVPRAFGQGEGGGLWLAPFWHDVCRERFGLGAELGGDGHLWYFAYDANVDAGAGGLDGLGIQPHASQPAVLPGEARLCSEMYHPCVQPPARRRVAPGVPS